jgi:S1-C subfamily serine protease
MICRPGTLLKIGANELATASGVIIDGDDAYVLTAGHACEGAVGKPVTFEDGNTWRNLGIVHRFQCDSGYDAGVIKVSDKNLVEWNPPNETARLRSSRFVELAALRGKSCRTYLGRGKRWVSGTITSVAFNETDIHDIEFTPAGLSGTNGDSGSPLVVGDNQDIQLAGVFVRKRNGKSVMHFLHATPALNLLGIPIP